MCPLKRSLIGDDLRVWYDLVAKVVNVNLTDIENTFVWELH